MSEPKRRGRTFRHVLLGGVVGGAIALVGTRSRRGAGVQRGAPEPVAGLEAFEGAPCWKYDRRAAGAGEPRPK